MTDKAPLPFETMVFVCTHQRAPGERVACANAGRDGLAILENLRKMVQEKGLTEKVRVCKSGCMDRCEDGPNVVITRCSDQTEYFKNVCPENIQILLEMLQKRD